MIVRWTTLFGLCLVLWGCGKEPAIPPQQNSAAPISTSAKSLREEIQEKWAIGQLKVATEKDNFEVSFQGKPYTAEPVSILNELSSQILGFVSMDSREEDQTRGGAVLTPLGLNHDLGLGIVLQTDGRTVVATNNGYIVRHNLDGTLDTSFNRTGVSTTFAGTTPRAFRALSIQTDAKLIGVGIYNSSWFFAVRYTTNGILDTSFQTTGWLATSMSGSGTAYGVTLQTDAKIVTVGWTSGNADFGVVRYTTDGSLDTSFNTKGFLITNLNSTDSATAVCIQTDAKIVAAGGANVNNDYGVARYTTDGALDTSYNTTGKIITVVSGNERFRAASLQSDGKLVGVGFTSSSTNFGLVRYTTDGALDTSFNTKGTIITDINSNDLAQAMSIQTDAKIIAAGYSGAGIDFTLARYNTDGSLDTSYNTTGTRATDISGGSDVSYGLALQTDGSLVAAGATVNGVLSNAIDLVRYLTDGSLDTTFSTTGKTTYRPGYGNSSMYGLALQRDGKLVGAGYTPSSSDTSDFALVRYNANGTLDTSFNSSGTLTTSLSGQDRVNAVVLQTDAKIVVAGFTSTAADFGLARYRTDGALDTSFNTSGKIITNFSGTDYAYGIALQTDAKIIAAGLSNGGVDLGLARYTTDGALDTSYNTSGKIMTDFSNTDIAYTVTVQTDGKVLAVGSADNASRFALFRYTTDGALDTSYATTGKMVAASASISRAYAVALQKDGKSVAAGGGSAGFARFNTDGSLDTSFATSGMANANVGNYSITYSLQISRNNKILLAGQGLSSTAFALSRFNTDGSLDTSFKGTGVYTFTTGDSDGFYGTVLQSDGRLVAGGATKIFNLNEWALIRIWP